MRDSKTTITLRKVRCFNAWNFAVGEGVPKTRHATRPYITYEKSDGWLSAAWVIVLPGFRTDTEENEGDKRASGWDRANRRFRASRENRAAALEEAKAWASTRYGIKEWARTPYGTWMDAFFVKERLAFLLDLASRTPDKVTETKPL